MGCPGGCAITALDPQSRPEIARGSMADADDVARAMDGVTHVLHLASCKEMPHTIAGS